MTTKMHYNSITGLQATAIVFIFVMFLVLSVTKFSIVKFQVIIFAVLLISWLLILTFLQITTNFGLFTDTVTVNEEGVTFKTKKETLSYEWHEVQKIAKDSAPYRRRSTYLVFHFILYTGDPVLKKKEIAVSGSTEFYRYLYQHYSYKIKK